MLTRLVVRNFKQFKDVDIALGNPVVFIGPNDSGKTTALQALALWNLGLKRWNEKRKGESIPEKRPAVTINRKDLNSIPVPSAKLLWKDLHVRDVQKPDGKQVTQNIRIDILVEGVTEDKEWKCGLEFDYFGVEAIYCRPLRLNEDKRPGRMPIPDEADNMEVAFLPPMSGLADQEFYKQVGEINFLIGQGRTAEVLRNLCYQLHLRESDSGTTSSITQAKRNKQSWQQICNQIKALFGVHLDSPQYIAERSEIVQTYRDSKGTQLDLSCSGRGLQQTLLLLAFMALNPGSVLLLDEPDAHLEILRQQQIYQQLCEMAQKQNSQIIAASHSEKLLNEAAGRDVVIAFLGKPHRIDDRGSQLLKALKDIPFDQYYQAEQKGWILYLEGATDLAILYAFAKKLNHPILPELERPFVHYVQNQPQKAREHFHGLREAKSDLIGFILCDRSDTPLQPTPDRKEVMWKRREIENYLCQPETLIAYATAQGGENLADTLFENPITNQWKAAMKECIEDIVPKVAQRDKNDQWWFNTKASDDFLDRLFDLFFKKLGLLNLMSKTNYHILTQYVPDDQIDPEITDVLNAILETAQKAKPIQGIEC